jgi:hypothetical protein
MPRTPDVGSDSVVERPVHVPVVWVSVAVSPVSRFVVVVVLVAALPGAASASGVARAAAVRAAARRQLRRTKRTDITFGCEGSSC